MSTGLPDFTTAPAWMDALGGVATQQQVMDYRGSLSDFSAGAPWTPLDTADEWVRRIDRDALAEVLDGCFPGCDGPAAEGFIERYAAVAVDAVLAALPDLMGGVA